MRTALPRKEGNIMFWTGLIVGLAVGGTVGCMLGVFVMALMVAAKDDKCKD